MEAPRWMYAANEADAKAEYVASMVDWSRKDLLRLLHRGGLKQGTARMTHNDLRIALWDYFGKPARAKCGA